MKFCPKCGNKIKRAREFCPSCGKNISKKITRIKNKKYIYIIIFLIIIAIIIDFALIPDSLKESSSGKGTSFLDFITKKTSTPAGYCGDELCSDEESCKTCIKDCGDCREVNYQREEFCGDGECSPEECSTRCTSDCSVSDCIDGICDVGLRENCENSPDCACSRGTKCELKQCVTFCGNGICEDNERTCDVNHCTTDCGACTCEFLGGDICGEKEICNLGYFDNRAKDTNLCCLGTCEDDPDFYPLIFIHGHSPTSDDGTCKIAGYSNCREGAIKSFYVFQNRMHNEGRYINKGYLLPGNNINEFNKGEWNYDLPISIMASYYADTTINNINTFKGNDYNQNIDEYSKRLARVVELVLHHTGSKKVKIVAHSMGGLVTRQYIRFHGGDKYVDRLLMIGTPNHGVKGGIKQLCGLFSSRPECEDMKYGSSFLSTLNSGDETYGNLVYATITGRLNPDGKLEIIDPCGDGTPNHDETVCIDSVPLREAENFYVWGNRVEGVLTDPGVHSQLINPSDIPQAYNIAKEFLER